MTINSTAKTFDEPVELPGGHLPTARSMLRLHAKQDRAVVERLLAEKEMLWIDLDMTLHYRINAPSYMLRQLLQEVLAE